MCISLWENALRRLHNIDLPRLMEPKGRDLALILLHPSCQVRPAALPHPTHGRCVSCRCVEPKMSHGIASDGRSASGCVVPVPINTKCNHQVSFTVLQTNPRCLDLSTPEMHQSSGISTSSATSYPTSSGGTLMTTAHVRSFQGSPSGFFICISTAFLRNDLVKISRWAAGTRPFGPDTLKGLIEELHKEVSRIFQVTPPSSHSLKPPQPKTLLQYDVVCNQFSEMEKQRCAMMKNN